MSNFTICITGHTGYIGSHFIEFLKRRGYSPFLIGRKATPTEPILGCKASDTWNSSAELKRQLFDLKDPVVINLAGLFASDHRSSNLDGLIEANFGYGISIMEAISELKEPKLVNIGTSWEFDDHGNKSAANLYAQLKSCNSDFAEWYARQYDIRTINLKLNDTFGGHDTRAKLMPLLKTHYSNGTIAQLKFSSQMVNFLHIFDLCEGLLAASQRTLELSHCSSETAFLIGKETVSMKELIERINSLSAKKLRVDFQGEYPKEHELKKVWTEAPLLPGWEPKLNLNDGIKEYFIGD